MNFNNIKLLCFQIPTEPPILPMLYEDNKLPLWLRSRFLGIELLKKEKQTNKLFFKILKFDFFFN